MLTKVHIPTLHVLVKYLCIVGGYYQPETPLYYVEYIALHLILKVFHKYWSRLIGLLFSKTAVNGSCTSCLANVILVLL